MVNVYLWRNPEASVQLGQFEIACLHGNATSCWNSWQTSSPTNTEIYRCDFQQIGERASYICDTGRQTVALNREAPSLTRMLKPRKPKLSAAQLFYSAKKPHQLLVKLIAVQSSALFAKEQPTCCVCNIQRSLLRFTVKRLRKNCPRKVESDNWSVS